MLTLRLAADDLNRLLPAEPGLRVSWENGHFDVAVTWTRFTVTARAHPDLRDGQIRFVLPMAELTGVPRPLVAGAWNYALERTEKDLAERLAAAGLPWDLVWLENIEDPERGRVARIGLAPALLNRLLAERLPLRGLRLRLAGLRVEPAAITLRGQLYRPQPETDHAGGE